MREQVKTVEEREESPRFKRIKQELLSTPVCLCPQRAYLITDYFKRHDDRSEPMVIRKAKALCHLLRHKSVRIYPDELIVGNMGSGRISALIQPELVGVFMGSDLLWIGKRKTTPLRIAWHDPFEAMEILKRAGVPAGVVECAEDQIYTDQQLKHRGFIIEVDHPAAGKHFYGGQPIKLSQPPALPSKYAPLLGEHTDEIMRDIWGMSTDEIKRLKEENILE